MAVMLFHVEADLEILVLSDLLLIQFCFFSSFFTFFSIAPCVCTCTCMRERVYAF